MPKQRIAIVGAGNMARARGRAFLDTGRAEICGVAARRAQRAAKAARLSWGATFSAMTFADWRRPGPDAILIEVPHRVQDEVSIWALDAGYDLLVGGCLASSVENGRQIVELAARNSRIVEAGFQRRYDPAWGGNPSPSGGRGTGGASDGCDHGPVEPRTRTSGTMTRRKAGGCR